MERGYVKLWRKTLDSGLLQHPTACQLFFYLLLKATHRTHRRAVSGMIFDLQPGDVIYGRKKAAEELGVSEQSLRTAAKLLEKLEIITSRSTNKCTVISFINWDKYQDDQPAPNQQTNQHLTSNQPAPNQHLTTNKNERMKEYKKNTDASHLVRSSAAADSTPPPEEPPVITLPLNTGAEHPVPQAVVDEWKALYPAVDVEQQLRNIRGWLLSNPTRRKTQKGIRRFVTGWLAREQNRSGPARASPAAGSVKSWQERESESNLRQFLGA